MHVLDFWCCSIWKPEVPKCDLGWKSRPNFVLVDPNKNRWALLGEISVNFTISAYITEYLLYFQWCAVLPSGGFYKSVLSSSPIIICIMFGVVLGILSPYITHRLISHSQDLRFGVHCILPQKLMTFLVIVSNVHATILNWLLPSYVPLPVNFFKIWLLALWGGALATYSSKISSQNRSISALGVHLHSLHPLARLLAHECHFITDLSKLTLAICNSW